jgi:glycosyltransferase involved in cell wall biosynthesis
VSDRLEPATPRVTIGLPVFNGERYLAEAIDSVLAQTFTDFELIVLDNASTDRTSEIVERYTQADARVRHVRHDTNIGAIGNYNEAVRVARGRYFKWLAYDDLCKPDMVQRCIDVLEADPTIVLCSARFVEIDAEGQRLGSQPYDIDLSPPDPADRIGNLFCTSAGHQILYGVIRRDVLSGTRLLAGYFGSDRALLAELALRGRAVELQDELWLSRDHPDRSSYVRGRAEGWQSQPGDRVVHATIAAHLARIFLEAPLSRRQRIRCVSRLAGCLRRRWRELASALANEIGHNVPVFSRRYRS